MIKETEKSLKREEKKEENKVQGRKWYTNENETKNSNGEK